MHEDLGTGAGFDDYYLAHVARVVRLAALLGAVDPEDVAQEAFCRLFASQDRLEGDPTPYLNRIVVNEVRSRARRAGTARDRAHLLRPVADALPAWDERRAVVEELGRLPRRQREALVLRFWLDLPLAQVAEAMGVRLGTAKSMVSRGLASLAGRLGDQSDPPAAGPPRSPRPPSPRSPRQPPPRPGDGDGADGARGPGQEPWR